MKKYFFIAAMFMSKLYSMEPCNSYSSKYNISQKNTAEPIEIIVLLSETGSNTQDFTISFEKKYSKECTKHINLSKALENSCPNNHTALTELIEELKKFNITTSKDNLNNAYQMIKTWNKPQPPSAKTVLNWLQQTT